MNNQKVEGIKVALCEKYAIEAYFYDVLTYTVKKMQQVGQLDSLDSDSFRRIENNFTEVVSVIFYDSSRVVIDEAALLRVSPTKRESIHDFPNVFEEFEEAKRLVENGVKEWNKTHSLIDNEDLFVYEVIVEAFRTIREVIRFSLKAFAKDNAKVFVAQLPNFNHTTTGGYGDLQVFLTIQGLIKKLTNYSKGLGLNIESFETDVESAFLKEGYKPLENKKYNDSDFAVTNAIDSFFIQPMGDSAKIVKDDVKELWQYNRESDFDTLRMKFEPNFLSDLVDDGIVTLQFQKVR